MPEVEGIDAISALKGMIKANPLAKVVMISAMGQEKVVEDCIQAGARDFIVKPFQSANVAGVVRAVLKSI
jgi:two-component system chemotaxis response regulator CheY